jgi:hypothetical protein
LNVSFPLKVLREKEVLQQAQSLVQKVQRGRATAEESLAEL